MRAKKYRFKRGITLLILQNTGINAICNYFFFKYLRYYCLFNQYLPHLQPGEF